MKIVRVKYLDHYDNVVREENIGRLGKSWIENLAWLVKEDDTHIFITREKWTEESTPITRLLVTAILKSQITEIEVLKEEEPKIISPNEIIG